MVVFTCNNCGDSVNKPKVDKHIQYECKRKHFAVSFCCVDCLKDFNHETVGAHCQCVTEEQRYSAKGFVPKPSSEKGKRKQASWVDIVQSVIDKKDLENDERQLLHIVAKFDNVPRKKSKFQNFCYSTAPAYRKKEYLVDKVFEMIEAEYKAQQIQNLNKKPTDTNNVQNKNVAENLEEKDSIKKESQKAKKKKRDVENSSNETEETPQKIKKTKKKSFDTVINEIETKSEGNIVPQSEKKKKKKRNNTVSEENMEIKDIPVEQIQSKSSKKNKIKSEIEKSNSVSKTENGVTNGENKIHEKTESQMSKKEKKKMLYQQNLATVTNSVTNGENLTHEKMESQMSKKEKKKLLYQQNLATVTNSVTNGENLTHEKMETQISKKEKKEMKKKRKYQQELATVTSTVIETEKEPLSKKKKRKLNNNEIIEEPHQEILKIEELPQDSVPGIQSGRKFEWNAAINQVLQSKKKKPVSISKVMKRVMNEYHFLNETTKKTENELEKIFLKKLKKIKNVVIDNDKVQLV